MKGPWRNRAALAAALVLAGCHSVPSHKDMGSPDTHAIVFGSLMVKTLLFPRPAYGFKIIQVNLEAAPHRVDTYGQGGRFYTDPIPVGESLKTYAFSTSERSSQGTTVITHLLGLQGKTVMDTEIIAPGLHYLGSFLFSAQTGGRYTYEPDKRTTERELLQEMLPGYAGTSWDPVIKARIKELK